jgi:multiple antibiotic resistance protein
VTDTLLEAAKFALACFVAIFTIVNPFSAAGLLVALTPGDTDESRRRQVDRAILFMTAIMLVSFFAGAYVLRFFSISQPALVLAAGLLVARSGWRTLTGTDRLTPAQREESLHKVDISFTPLGMPLLAGPGTISVLIGLAADSSGAMRDGAAVVAILLVSAVSWPVLRAAPAVVRRMGSSGEAALSKVMGLLILCVGIQFLINGIGMVVRDLAR